MNKRLLHGFYIKNRDGQRIKYRRRKAQEHFAKNKTGRNIILKARQLGLTTEMQLNFLEKALKYEYITCATISHKSQLTKDIFRIAKFAWDNLSPEIQTLYQVKYENVRELTFEANGSSYFVDIDTRGRTVQHLHVSEAARIKNWDQFVAGTFAAIPKSGTITLESTAIGLNHFYDIWQAAVAGENQFKPFFYNWMWEEDYMEDVPASDEWMEDYQALARKYNLLSDVQGRLGATKGQFYWYYLQAREYKELTKQEFPCTADEAFLSNGASVFDLYKVVQLKSKEPIEHLHGFRIYYKPELEHRYIIGIDTSEGIDSDDNAIEILDATDLRQVASFNDPKINPAQVADLAVRLAKIYNNAYIIPERNNSGLTTVLKLVEIGYTNIYRERSLDKITKQSKDQWGWRTTGTNRDTLIDDFVEAFDQGQIEINDANTISQMKTFIRKENGKREHDENKHDDSLFALFLALQGIRFHRSNNAMLDYYKQAYGNTGPATPSFLQSIRETHTGAS